MCWGGGYNPRVDITLPDLHICIKSTTSWRCLGILKMRYNITNSNKDTYEFIQDIYD